MLNLDPFYETDIHIYLPEIFLDEKEVRVIKFSEQKIHELGNQYLDRLCLLLINKLKRHYGNLEIAFGRGTNELDLMEGLMTVIRGLTTQKFIGGLYCILSGKTNPKYASTHTTMTPIKFQAICLEAPPLTRYTALTDEQVIAQLTPEQKVTGERNLAKIKELIKEAFKCK